MSLDLEYYTLFNNFLLSYVLVLCSVGFDICKIEDNIVKHVK